MTARYQHLALSQVKAGMVLSDELLDRQGQVLLPQGSILNDAMLALMPRHGIETLPIASEEVPAEELAATQHAFEQRIAHLFRKNDTESDTDWATGLLRRFVTAYRLGPERTE